MNIRPQAISAQTRMQKYFTLAAIAIALISSLLATSHATAVMVETGFNDILGINSTATPNSPYTIDPTIAGTIHGRGESEPGWLNNWTVSGGGAIGGPSTRAVSNGDAPFEGDGVLYIKETTANNPTWINRRLSEARDEPFIIEQQVRLDVNGAVSSRPGQQGTGTKIGPQWSARQGTFWAYDGTGSGGGAYEDTGIPWTPMAWHHVALHIDPINQVFDLFIDGAKYHSPDPLNFRGNINSIYQLEYLTGSEVWIDDLRVYSVPEPSTYAMAGLALLRLGAFAWRRRRVA